MVSLLVTEWSTGSRTERIICFLDVYPGGAAYCHGCKLACIRPDSKWGRWKERRSGRSNFWPNTNRTVIDGKIVVSSTHDGTSQPVCTHCWFTWCFLWGWYPPRNTNAPANSAIHLEHLYQKKKKNWVPLVMSNMTGGVDINW